MFDKYQLIAEIRKKGYTQAEIAKKIGIASCTMSKKMNDGSFKATEMWKLVEILEIKHPETIFFASEVSPNYTKEET